MRKCILCTEIVIWYIGTIQLLLLVRECQPTKSMVIDELIEKGSKIKSVDPLNCHVCHSETHRHCFNLTDNDNQFFGYPRECDKDSSYCMVRRFSFTLTDENQTWPMKTFGVKRSCTTKCDPGCVIMGERTRLYVCNACCQNQLCNTGNSSDGWTNRRSGHFWKFLETLNALIVTYLFV